MVQGYAQTNSGGSCRWATVGRKGEGLACSLITAYPSSSQQLLRPYSCRDTYEQRPSHQSEEFGLPGPCKIGREVGGTMLSITGLNHFYYVRDFTDMCCKHSRVLFIIRELIRREPSDGDVFIVMSKNRRIVRMFTYDNRSYSRL